MKPVGLTTLTIKRRNERIFQILTAIMFKFFFRSHLRVEEETMRTSCTSSLILCTSYKFFKIHFLPITASANKTVVHFSTPSLNQPLHETKFSCVVPNPPTLMNQKPLLRKLSKPKPFHITKQVSLEAERGA